MVAEYADAGSAAAKQTRNFAAADPAARRVGHDCPMARVELLDADTAPLTTQQYFAGGDPGPIVAALATVPEMLGPTLGFVGAALGAGSIGVRAKEFAILRTSALQGCNYCIHAHTTAALDVGLTPSEVHGLRGETSIDEAFPSVRERALIAWIDALAGATGAIGDDVWTTAREHWEEHDLVEISVTVGATMFLNRFATGLQLPTAPHVLDRLAEEGMS
jgi:AhpD family alkylhydroperoxidase